MTYRLQLNAVGHQASVASILESCREQDQDLILIPQNGLPVITHSLNLSLHSPSLRTLMASLPPSSPHSLSIPAPYSTLTNLLKLLIKGQVSQQQAGAGAGK